MKLRLGCRAEENVYVLVRVHNDTISSSLLFYSGLFFSHPLSFVSYITLPAFMGKWTTNGCY